MDSQDTEVFAALVSSSIALFNLSFRSSLLEVCIAFLAISRADFIPANTSKSCFLETHLTSERILSNFPCSCFNCDCIFSNSEMTMAKPTALTPRFNTCIPREAKDRDLRLAICDASKGEDGKPPSTSSLESPMDSLKNATIVPSLRRTVPPSRKSDPFSKPRCIQSGISREILMLSIRGIIRFS